MVQPNPLNVGYTDIVVDVSGMPRGVFFPLVARLLYFIDVEWNTSERDIPNLFLLVAEDPDLDTAITQKGIEEFADFVAMFRGAFDQEAQLQPPKNSDPILERIVSSSSIAFTTSSSQMRFVQCYHLLQKALDGLTT